MINRGCCFMKFREAAAFVFLVAMRKKKWYNRKENRNG